MKDDQYKEALETISGLNQQSMVLPREFIGSTGNGSSAAKSPEKLSTKSSLNEIFTFARDNDVSDIHLSANNPIVMRKYAKLVEFTEDVLSADQLAKIITDAFPKDEMQKFNNTGDLEFVYTLAGAGRFRVTLMKQRLGWDLTTRLIPMKINTFEESGMPESCQKLTKWTQGMVLVTGPAGCGKTTTLATLVEMINQSRPDHIITIEDPIEFVFEQKECQVTQRQIGLHTLSQANALRAALREDPDIIVVSELRDLESIQLAVTAAETGHLVLGTMNTINAAQTISRIIDSFPSDKQEIIRNMISESLRGVISQQIIPKKDGSGLVPAFEVLVVNTAISNMIREDKINQVTNTMATSKADGMVLLDQSLERLVKNKIIDANDAYVRAVNPDNFVNYLSEE